ncbi:hypothetical protein ACWGHA_24025 [Streptomyces xanthophaeus]
MSTAEYARSSAVALEDHLASVDEMVVQPFPERDFDDVTGWGGPGHRVRVLGESEPFWEDDGTAWDAAHVELEAQLDAVAAVCTARWGEPRAVDLRPYLVAGCDGEAVPEPLDSLSQQTVWLRVWPLPDGERMLALSLGQADGELPLVLYAAVGHRSALDAGGVGSS